MKQYLNCGCVPDGSGYGWCAVCCIALKKDIWNKMSKEQKNYDREFDPNGSRLLDELCGEDMDCCSCHINPPCSFCLSKPEEEV